MYLLNNNPQSILGHWSTPFLSTQHYVDGAVSDNLPRCHLKNTITFSAYAGESDICPRGSTLNFHEVRFNNVSIQVDTENMYRVTSTFFPPVPEVRRRAAVRNILLAPVWLVVRVASYCCQTVSKALRFLFWFLNVFILPLSSHSFLVASYSF